MSPLEKNVGTGDVGASAVVEQDAQDAPAPVAKPPYSLYLLLCKGNVIYAGITNNVDKRYLAHCSGKGAKFTRSRPPLKLLCQAVVGNRSEAQSAEYAVKQLPRGKKLAFVAGLGQQCI